MPLWASMVHCLVVDGGDMVMVVQLAVSCVWIDRSRRFDAIIQWMGELDV